MSTITRMGALVVAGLLVAGCGGDAPTTDATDATDAITVTGTADLRFDPDAFTVPAGERVSVELTSEGVEHDFVLEDAADVGQVHEMMDDHDMDMDAPEGDLEVVHADAGETVTGSFTIDEPGTYAFYCAIPGHRQAGMGGTLEVVDTTG